MATKKSEKNETTKLVFEVRREGEFELWRSRSWGPASGKHVVVVDTFPNNPNLPPMHENLTDMLIFNEVQKMEVVGYTQVHLFAKQPAGSPNNHNLDGVDDQVKDLLIEELVSLVSQSDMVVMAHGSISRRLVMAEAREKQFLDALQRGGLSEKVKYLVEPMDPTKNAAPVSRKVREGGQEWVLAKFPR
jgi:hypothetical protein